MMIAYRRIRLGRNSRKKIIAGLLTGILVISVVLPYASVFAAEPSVTTDEAMYVNLDYYGSIKDVSIVKSCSLNGLFQFRDYGDYETVTNMSTYDQPELTGDGVQWNLDEDTAPQRFYYNCTVRNDVVSLPWDIDVSYKLNGQPCKAETLAGADGLVQIDINVKPNDNAKEYYKNNMLLQIATYIDTEDAYSLDAPGSQLQSLGTYKAVLFAALPGEEDTYTIRIGTNSFESKGITMMMIPGTLKQMEQIKDIKEAKDTVHDSANAIYLAMNDFLNTAESMNQGLNDLKNGAIGAEDARSTFSAGKAQMYQYGDTALADIGTANEQLKQMIPYFKTGKKMTKELNGEINDLVDTMQEMKDPLYEASDELNEASDDLESLQDMLDVLNGQIETSLMELGEVAMGGMATPYEATQLQGEAEIAATLDQYSRDINSLLSETMELAQTTAQIADITQDLIDETADMGDTFDAYHDDLLDLLDDCQTLTEMMNTSIDSSVTFMTYSKKLLEESGDKLDSATAESLQGLTDVLDKSILGLSSITTMRNANDTIKSTIDREFDKYEKENRFLNLDAQADLISFTSDNNPAPTSIQIILRTDEISLDDGDDNDILDLEVPKAKLGFIARVKNLFNKILQIFK